MTPGTSTAVISRQLPLDASLSGSLGSDEVQVWCFTLDRSSESLPGLWLLLSPDEKVRADRFYFERDRTHYVVGRSILRTLLGGYLGQEPARLQFDYGRYGKPGLKTTSHAAVLQFNLSHTGSLAVYAFSLNRRIGIDVEQVRSMPNQDRFIEHYFSPQECALIHSLPGDEQQGAFFKIWSCKEAFFKTSGDGLTQPIQEAVVSLTSAGSARLDSIAGDAERAAAWRLETFQPAAGYQAALAVEENDWRLTFLPRTEDPLW